MICTTNKILRISVSLDLYKTKCIIIVHARKKYQNAKNLEKNPIGLILKSTICHFAKNPIIREISHHHHHHHHHHHEKRGHRYKVKD